MKKNAMPCVDALVEPMRVMLTLTCHDFPVKETQPQIGKLEVLVCVCVWGTSEETQNFYQLDYCHSLQVTFP